jgi:hypothetical protein
MIKSIIVCLALILFCLCSQSTKPPFVDVTIKTNNNIEYNIYVDGKLYKTPLYYRVHEGDEICILAADSLELQANEILTGVSEKYYFSQWSDGVKNNNRVLLVDSDTTVQIELIKKCRIEVNTEPSYINAFIEGSGWHFAGDSLILVAPKIDNYSLFNWKVNNIPVSSKDTLILLVTTPCNVLALYKRLCLFSVDFSLDTNIKIKIDSSLYNMPFSVKYPVGKVVMLKVPSPQEKDLDTFVLGNDMKYEFTSWNDSEINNSRIITIEKDITLSPIMKIFYKIETQTNPKDIGIIKDSGWKEKDSIAILLAPKIENFVFDHWEINGKNSGTDNPINVKIDGPKKIIGYYKPSVLVTLQTMPLCDYSVRVDSVIYTMPKTLSRYFGDNIVIDVSSVMEFDEETGVSGKDTRYEFARWWDGDTLRHRIFGLDKDTTLRMILRSYYKLEVGTSPESLVNIVGNGWYLMGDTVRLVALSKAGYLFDGWEVDGVFKGKRDTVEIVIDKAHRVVGEYKRLYNLTLSSSPYDSVKIRVDSVIYRGSKTLTYVSGSLVTLYVESSQDVDGDSLVSGVDSRYTFVMWSDMVTANPRNVLVDKDISLSAQMGVKYKVEIGVIPEGIGGASSFAWYDYGALVSISAPSINKYAFDHWEINGSFYSNDSIINIGINKPLKIEGIYKRKFKLQINSSLSDLNVVIKINDKSYTLPLEIYFPESTAVKIIVPSFVEEDRSVIVTGNDSRYLFFSWEDGPTSLTRNMIITKDTSLTLNYNLYYKIQDSLNLVSENIIKEPHSYDNWYLKGTQVKFKATCSNCYTFNQWIVNWNKLSIDDSIQITIDEPKYVFALYDLPPSWKLVASNTNFTPRDGLGAIVFNGKIWMYGGWIGSSTLNEIWCSSDAINWRLINSNAPWNARHCFGLVEYNNKLWIIGGDDNTDVWSSENGKDWTLVIENAPWGKRYKPYVCVYKNKIWLMGGFDYFNNNYQPYNDVWNTEDGRNWTKVIEHASWQPRGIIHGSVVFKDKMWIIGGGLYGPPPSYWPEVYYNDVWSSEDGINWVCETPDAQFAPRIHHNVAVFDNKIWVMDGHYDIYNTKKLLNDVWYSLDGKTWNELKDTPWSPRHATATFIYNGELYLMGGCCLYNDVWKLTFY